MKNYGISNDKRKTVLLIIFIMSLFAGSYLYSLINTLLMLNRSGQSLFLCKSRNPRLPEVIT